MKQKGSYAIVNVLRMLIAIAAAASLTASNLSAQNGSLIGNATFVESGPTIDGLIDDAVWARAQPITGFVQQEPDEGRPASEKTEVRILYDGRAVYIGAILYDTEPERIVVTDSRRDSELGDMDSFQVIFDTYHDLQNGFVFGTNPAGIEYDGQVSNEGQGGGGGGGAGGRGRGTATVGSGSGFNKNWDASWTVRTRVTDVGWTAEFEIPIRSLRYGPKPQIWGLNFQRNIRRKREQVFWAPVARLYNLYRLSTAGELHGLDLDEPRNFKVTPYTTGSVARAYDDPTQTEPDADGSVGLDAKFGVTPSLTLDVTYNTDFAQVEVDEQVINLTRFNVRFPEKRPFFLENAGLLAAGKSGVDLFFSRSIGIGPDGAPVPIVGGTRLSGRTGGLNVGFLMMRTDRVPGEPGEPDVVPKNNFAVARVSREFPNRSSLGGIFVSRDAAGPGSAADDLNRTYGVDGKLGLGENVDFRGFVARTETPGLTGDEMAYNVRGQYRRGGLDTHIEFTQLGDDFNPEVGFLTRRAFQSIDSRIFLRVRTPSVSWLRELRPHTQVTTIWDLDGFREGQTWHFDSHIDFESGWFISPAIDVETEGFQEDFEVAPGVFVPAGEYTYWETDWRLNSDQSRPLAFSTVFALGEFLAGDQTSINATLTARSGSSFNASIGWSRRDIRLPWGNFTTNLAQARFNYSFSPRVNFQSLIQYNDRADNWGGNLRFGWLNASGAGTGLFVVYNESQRLEGLGPIHRTFVIKYSRQFDVLR